jgi:hypothetical protein
VHITSATHLSAPNRNVFINCPFDEAYRGCFEALLFAVTVSGYKVRCALEDDDAANIRFDKRRRLIRESARTIHDLSRTELGKNDLPRFNMPFELGLAMGAKYFGSKVQRRNSALIMVREPYLLPSYLSDLAGNDPAPHGGDPHNVLGLVRRYLHVTPRGKLLPGPRSYITGFTKFKADLPGIAAELEWGSEDIDAFQNYRVYLDLLNAFVETAKQPTGE